MLVLALGIVAQCTCEVLCVLLLQPEAVGSIAVITVNYEQRWTLHGGCCETSVWREASCDVAAEDKVGVRATPLNIPKQASCGLYKNSGSD